ncbi:E3 SUMO-protein ligase SIZ2, partial [Trichinella spiralis]|uniref:E3 SUMO-protein ligase SIZ2 n=1 Tax=Trichinella spiralis TaxID=6334 RepID=UPI0001EFD49F
RFGRGPEMAHLWQRFNDPINITSHLLGDRKENCFSLFDLYTAKLSWPRSPLCSRDHRNKYMNSGDVLVVSERFSLQCPLSKKRLTYACRSSLCCHIDCFDGLQFLLHSYNCTVLKCPICGQIIPLESVVLDEVLEKKFP